MNSEDFNKCREFLEKQIENDCSNTELIKTYARLIELKSEHDIKTHEAIIKLEISQHQNQTDYNKTLVEKNTEYNVAVQNAGAQIQQNYQNNQAQTQQAYYNNAATVIGQHGYPNQGQPVLHSPINYG